MPVNVFVITVEIPPAVYRARPGASKHKEDFLANFRATNPLRYADEAAKLHEVVQSMLQPEEREGMRDLVFLSIIRCVTIVAYGIGIGWFG